jgi:hypothetical protein
MTERAPARVWDNTATYEAYMGRWSRPVAEAIVAWLGLGPGLTWLDVGCGTGALTQAILSKALVFETGRRHAEPGSRPRMVSNWADPDGNRSMESRCA